MTDRYDDVPVLLIPNTETRDQLLLASVLGLLFLAGYAALVYADRGREPTTEDYLSYTMIGIMAVLGAGWAAWLLLGRYRFGDLTLEVHGRLALGETVRLRIPVPRALQGGKLIVLTIVAQRVERQGDGSSITELWRARHEVRAPAAGARSVDLTCEFPSGPFPAQRMPDGHVRWNLTLHADLPGVDLVRNFELPVARARGRHPLVD